MKISTERRDLIEACKRGDSRAMEKIYAMYYKPMFNTAYRIINDFHFAEDIMQESFLKAFANLHRFEGRSTFGAWLKRIVVNESLNWLKKYKRFDNQLQEEQIPEQIDREEDETEFFHRVEPGKLLQALGRLKDNYRTILSLYYLEGYDYEEIMEIMGLSYQHARTMLSRAKNKLKKLLENGK